MNSHDCRGANTHGSIGQGHKIMLGEEVLRILAFFFE